MRFVERLRVMLISRKGADRSIEVLSVGVVAHL